MHTRFDSDPVGQPCCLTTHPCGRRLALLLGVLWPLAIAANDVPAPAQKVGNHSTVATTSGEISDKELVDFICAQIQASGGEVRDVKLMVNSSYGGGLLDDMQRAFGPGGACAGIPWVAGSASAPDQPARGWTNQTLGMYPGHRLGSTWTDGLVGNSPLNTGGGAGVIHNGSASNNVLQDLQSAAQQDAMGPNGAKKETPQVASGNGGDNIMWTTPNTRHEAVVFGGLQTDQRHHNNVANVRDALQKTWENEADPHIWTLDGGSKQDLFDKIADAASRLDENTQLVIYIDDHGGIEFDFEEAIGAVANILIRDQKSMDFDIPNGWPDGMFGNYFATNHLAASSLQLDITECNNCSNWYYLLNDYMLEFPGGDRTGLVEIPVPFPLIFPGANILRFHPAAAPLPQSGGGSLPQTQFGTLKVSGLRLGSGPINELEAEDILVAGQSAAYFNPDRNGEGIFVELLNDRRALVYVFSYNTDGSGQAWMLGVGEQVSEGIIVHEMLQPRGATFGAGFDPDDVVREDFGSLYFQFPTCRTNAELGSLFIYPKADTGFAFLPAFDYQQLTVLVDCQTGMGSANSRLSGSWYDPSHDGEGIILEVQENGNALVQWFTYDGDGDQMWIQGVGTFSGDTLTVDEMYTTQGPAWGPVYDPSTFAIVPWGSLTMEFTGCDEARMEYASTVGFGNGAQDMVRLTKLMGIPCTQ